MITSIKSPFLEYKMTILRNKKSSNSLFRQTMNEASYLIAAEVLKHLKYKKVTVQTPLTKTTGKDIRWGPGADASPIRWETRKVLRVCPKC